MTLRLPFAVRYKDCEGAIEIEREIDRPDSSWFTNRIGTQALTIDEIVRGPNVGHLLTIRAGSSPGRSHLVS